MGAIGTLNGGVVIADHAADFQTLHVHKSQPKGEVTAWGQTGESRNKGSGTQTYTVDAAGFINISSPGDADDEEGGACTFTIAGGRTITGTFLCHDIDFNGSRIGFAWPVTFQLTNNGPVVSTV